MKKPLALLAAAVIALLALAGCSSGPGAISDVDAAAFLQKAAQPGVTVIDVRSPAEYAAGHLDGAVNIDVEGPSFTTDIQSLDKAGTYALYCHSGRRSSMAASAMAGAAFTSIVNLKGGIADLQAAGGAIVAGP
jgi:rhodanese-related sulfurtransferase